MLIAFKEELKRMAGDANDDFHGKVRKRIGKKATQILEKRLKQFILLMPSLMKRIQIHWKSKDANAASKKLGGFVFAYMYHPHDFLSEDEHGLFGYLDDAYVVASVYEHVLRNSAKPSPEDQEFIQAIEKTKKYVEMIIPEESKKIEKMIGDVLNDKGYEKFASAFTGDA